MKKQISLAMAAAMAMSMTMPVMADGVSLTIFNSKSEIQSQMDEMAAKYSAEKGVDAVVYYSSDTVAAHMATKYASGEPYVLAMVDAKDIYSLGAEHAIDMTGADWVANTNYAIGIDGQVNGYPVCVEARGLMYNKAAIEGIIGEEFVPENYETLDAFKGLIDTLKEGGMESPVAIMKEDWSLGAHYLQQVYEEQPDVDACIDALYAGEFDLANDAKWNSLMDTFDVLKENNIWKDAPIAAEREMSEAYLAMGDVAFMFGGNWDWSLIKEFDEAADLGMMALPQNTEDGTNKVMLGGGSKFFMIDNSDKVTDEQRQAAIDFLNWLALDPEGQDFVVNTCSLVPAFSSNELPVSDPLGASVKAFADNGQLLGSYNYAPDDHYAKLGASFQKYLADQIDRDGFAAEVCDYWKTTTPVAH